MPQGTASSQVDLGCGLFAHKKPIEYYIHKIQSLPQYAFNKINHAGWEIIAHCRSTGNAPVPSSYLVEIARFLYRNYKTDDIDFGASPFGPPKRIMFNRRRVSDHTVILEEIKRYKFKDLHLGTIWKDYCIDGTILELFRAFKDRYIIFIGLPHFTGVAKQLHERGYGDYLLHLEVKPPTGLPVIDENRRLIPDGSAIRWHIFHRMLRVPKGSICLVQCGELLSTWLTHKIREKRSDLYIIDIGRSLDCLSVEGNKQGWVKQYREDLTRNLWCHVPRAS